MSEATEEQYAELVGYTGHNECLEIRYCTHGHQVWDSYTDYGVGLGLMRKGYWVGTEQEHQFLGSRAEVESYASYIDSPIRWI